MNSDVEKIIDIFIKDEPRFNNLQRYIWGKKAESIPFIVAIISLVIGLIASLLNYINEAFIAYIVCFLSLSLYSVSSALSTFLYIFGAKRQVLEEIKMCFKQDREIVKFLSIFQSSDLELVKSLFEKRVTFLVNRVGFLVGVIDKLGLVPALIMIYFSYAKLSSTSEGVFSQALFVGFIAGLYLGVLIAKSLIDSLRDKVSILELAIKESRPTFELP
ncbi:hypothetical protein [Aliivibrio fischeri]|uniref:hypothetical protein n=1 Tax=Aliivibrio fischeri TaxID=668 RepID=UPI00084CC622|nr:hypothetical protein [Aliivibrio fischeri]OED53479.1 hypothetical protein BEI46_17600 [Aliivibrio fischeri]